MSQVTDILDDLGIPYKLNGWEPKTPPKGCCYAVVDEEFDDFGSDFVVMGRRVSELVALYDFGTPKGEEMRKKLHEALSDANLKHSMSSTIYFKDEKVFQTEYDLESRFEKRRF